MSHEIIFVTTVDLETSCSVRVSSITPWSERGLCSDSIVYMKVFVGGNVQCEDSIVLHYLCWETISS